ncbi:MAG: pyrroloquinoline quinone biosynthesis protein PqqB [Propionibacteriales bacterium]|nr:pyrroloquinoline quinone biosynthesis protein PqqB [Propionibacteriales bacterium]
MYVHCLGAAAGGGYPQWNCACVGCRAARENPGRATLHASVAVSGDGDRWFLLNATPDVHHQIAAEPALHPGPGTRETPLSGVLLTDAELDHTIGLLVMREGSAYTVFGTAAVLAMLAEEFPVRRLLRDYADVTWREAVLGAPMALDDTLTATAFAAGTKHPRYAVSQRHDSGSVVGYRLEDARTGVTAVYAPALAHWDDAVQAELEKADCVIVDGTFWRDTEMIHTGSGRRRGSEMGHLAIDGPGGSAERLAMLPARYKIYTHINNTNPILDDSSPELRRLAELGILIGRAGLRVEL